MTAQILSSELTNLVQESKRKNSELRNSAEKSLQDLKALPITSETQLAADLCRRPYFISPFLVACGTHNAKFGASAVACLQRLATVRALPKERLKEVLVALKESSSLGHDIQLKILQALPPLLQNYSIELRGELLSSTLEVCSTLQTAKNPAVSNTAAATLQQLVISVFDRVVTEDEKSLEIPTVADVPGDGVSLPVRPAAHDAYKVSYDLNIMVDGGKQEFMRFAPMPQASALELIESILSNHGEIVSTHPEQGQILKSLLMPMIIRSLSDRLDFPLTLRTIRVLYVLIRNHIDIMTSECEIALGLLNHMLDPEASPPWKRALCLEVFRGIYLDSSLVLRMYGVYDDKEGKKSIFRDNLAAFVRLATEKPAAIGLGQHSTIPTVRGEGRDSASEQAALEASISGVISSVHTGGSQIGISTQWSSMRAPCMDQLDKSEPPTLPETYIYSLVLTCINNLSEGLAKFILPLTVHHENKNRRRGKTEDSADDPDDQSGGAGTRRLSRTQSYRKKTVPINPLALKEHVSHVDVQSTASLITNCWPAVLATCSTFLNAALDTDYYRALVRAIQKFTQVAGLLRLATPRDAFLTSLGKAAVPPHLLIASTQTPKSSTAESPSFFSNTKGLLSVDSIVSQASQLALDKSRRSSVDISVPTLNARNLLCLRALLNLAIALGPTLGTAWSIIFETLQQADLLMAAATSRGGNRDFRSNQGMEASQDTDMYGQKIGSEISAVEAAVHRLFESTVDFPNDAFVEILEALCKLLHPTTGLGNGSRPNAGQARPATLHQRRISSISGMSISTELQTQDYIFALTKIGDLATLNETRLALYDAKSSGWDVLIRELVSCCADAKAAVSTRILAAEIVSRTVKDIAAISLAAEKRSEIQSRVLSALQMQISYLYDQRAIGDESVDEDGIKVHLIALESLKSIIEQCGESLTAGWDDVFLVLLSSFKDHDTGEPTLPRKEAVSNCHIPGSIQAAQIVSKRLARSAFGSVQLICSDFLAAVPNDSLSKLLELLIRFCSQEEDLNMSLTTITFFWNVSDFLHSESNLSFLPSIINGGPEQADIRHQIEASSQKGAIPALWLQVLLHLSSITTDSRAEVRNGAVHSILRIFENYVDQLSPEAWMLCLRTVLFEMIEANLAAQIAIRKQERSTLGQEAQAWNDTTKIALSTVSSLLSAYMGTSIDPSSFGDAWCALLKYLEKYFECGSHALGASIFTTVTEVLSKVEDTDKMGMPALLQTASMWKRYFDHSDTWSRTNEGNQDAFIAYAEAFKAIYQLTKDRIESKTVLSMLSNLEQCIVYSHKVSYSSDLDYTTPLQTQVMECLSSIRHDTAGAPSFLTRMLSRFVALPFTSATNTDRSGPTFVALSKASMNLLQIVVRRHISEEDILNSGAFQFALASLAKPITQKYTWKLEGKPPTTWQKATSTALAILEPALKQIESRPLESSNANAIWDQIVLIAHGITSADISSTTLTTPLANDEKFDITAFTQLVSMITQPLGSPNLPDPLRRTYTRNLFATSLIHAPAPGEIPTRNPLEDLYKTRHGRTNDPEPTIRSGIAYLCLSELVTLVSVSISGTSSSERIKLAQAAAPYLILRAALPLKTYIADQPLRGRMPQPESQRHELLFVLRKMGELECESEAIPETEGVRSEHRKHLHRLFPLLMKACRVAGQDEEVFERLVALVEGVGEEFGV